ncbi:unnamed protein product [Agarophyton chilense]
MEKLRLRLLPPPKNQMPRKRFKKNPAQNRYRGLQDKFSGMDDHDLRLFGVGGGVMGDLEDLLMAMRETKDEYDFAEMEIKTAERKKEQDK